MISTLNTKYWCFKQYVKGESMIKHWYIWQKYVFAYYYIIDNQYLNKYISFNCKMAITYYIFYNISLNLH